MIRRAISFKTVDADFSGGMEIPTGSRHSGSTWQLLHRAFPLNKSSPRFPQARQSSPRQVAATGWQADRTEVLKLGRDLVVIGTNVWPVGSFKSPNP
jgi:hypothetical protein